MKRKEFQGEVSAGALLRPGYAEQPWFKTPALERPVLSRPAHSLRRDRGDVRARTTHI